VKRKSEDGSSRNRVKERKWIKGEREGGKEGQIKGWISEKGR
jgi:hypothetical protein